MGRGMFVSLLRMHHHLIRPIIFIWILGNRLGSEGEAGASAAVPAPQAPVRSTPSPEALESVTRNLTFWRNGYSLEDGPLMSYEDPANREFLDAINRGYDNYFLTCFEVTHL